MKLKDSSFYSIVLLTFVSITTGCGGSNSNKSTAPDPENNGPVSRVDGAKVLSSISDADAKTVCEDLVSYDTSHFNDSDAKRLGCVTQGLFASFGASDPLATCNASLQNCEQGAAEGSEKEAPTVGTDPCGAEVRKTITSCSGVTVAELAACHKDQVTALKELSCETELAKDKPVNLPASCATIDARCPKIRGSASGSADAKTGSMD